MKFDFTKYTNDNTSDKLINPIEIFNVIPGKSPKYEYLRSVQNEVLQKWYDVRDNKDIVLKMNTGSGKTVVGLLLLKSCLNERKSPAIFITPSNQLVSQVIKEAEELGISATTDYNDFSFTRGKSILVASIYTLINGKSKFGMKDIHAENIEIGSILIDDVHSCLNTTEDQFKINIDRDCTAYNELFTLFKKELYRQSENKAYEIDMDIKNSSILIPFWTWKNERNKILEIITKHASCTENFDFKWDLVKDNIELCNCLITPRTIEITPFCIPIHKIVSFIDAKRRIFMSATFSDDTPLISHFDVDSDKLKLITPNLANDIGERMILVPQEINPLITDDEIKKTIKSATAYYNVVIIVPSRQRAKYWEDVANSICIGDEVEIIVEKLKTQHIGLVVIINRFDGIDLPDNACRILVIDGLPTVVSEYNKLEESALHNSKRFLLQKIQKVEQGMGRGVRSITDYCVVLMMGRALISSLYSDNALSKFSDATKAQMELSASISEDMKDASLRDIIDMMNNCLNRNVDWIKASKSALLKVEYKKTTEFDERMVVQRKAYNYALKKLYNEAANLCIEQVNLEEDAYVKGWIQQKAATYINFYDPVEAQNTLKSALSYSLQVTKPIEGIQYDKRLKKYEGQAQNIVSYIKDMKLNANTLILEVNKLCEYLIFEPDTANLFEETVKNVGFILGFYARRPEQEVGKGPDVIWQTGVNEFIVIECKNGTTNPCINKHDCNQLNGSIEWFQGIYSNGFDVTMTPIMIHIGSDFEYASSPNRNIRIVTQTQLEELKKNLKEFCIALSSNGNLNDVNKINQLLDSYKLTNNLIVSNYTIKYNVNNR